MADIYIYIYFLTLVFFTFVFLKDVLVTQSGSRASLRHSRASRNVRSQPHAITDPSQEYELMIKQTAVLPHSPGDGNGSVLVNPPRADQVTCSSSLYPREAVQTQNNTNEREDRPVSVPTDNERTFEKSCEDSADVGTALDERQQHQAAVEYEDMDVRNESMLEEAHANSVEPREESIYQNTRELPAPKNRRRCKADEDSTFAEQAGEYEDMNAHEKVCTSGARLEYQNFPARARMVSGEEPHRVQMRAFRGACTGEDENSSSTSFDNPDYWHSRLFHKPDAVCT